MIVHGFTFQLFGWCFKVFKANGGVWQPGTSFEIVTFKLFIPFSVFLSGTSNVIPKSIFEVFVSLIQY